MERFAFYERAKKAFAVVATGYIDFPFYHVSVPFLITVT